MTDWFRSWHGAPTDAKWLAVSKRAGVSPGIVSAIVWALLDHASQQEEDRGRVDRFDVETYAAFSGFPENEIEAVLSALREKGLIVNGRLASWQKRQPKREDGSAERSKDWRERNRTQPNARERPEKSRADKNRERGADAADAAPAPGDSRLGSRLPEDWIPDKDLVAWAKATRPDLNIDTVVADFRDFWLAKPGAAGRKLDWARTFKRWVRNEKQNRTSSAPPKFGPKEFKPVDRDAIWSPRLQMWSKSKTWLDSWGPKPGEPHCEVPKHLLEAA